MKNYGEVAAGFIMSITYDESECCVVCEGAQQWKKDWYEKVE